MLPSNPAPAWGITPGRHEQQLAAALISASRHLDTLSCRKAVVRVRWNIYSTTCPYFIEKKLVLWQKDTHHHHSCCCSSEWDIPVYVPVGYPTWLV